MPDFDKYTKEECDYGPGDWPNECGTCAHAQLYDPPKGGSSRYTSRFDRWALKHNTDRGTCKIVQGKILGQDLCKFHVFKKGQEHLEDQEGGEEVSGPPDLSKTYDLGKDPKFEKFVRGYIGRAEGRTGTEGWCDICNQYVESTHRH